jgi:hypothetical protein
MKGFLDGKAFERYCKTMGITSYEEAWERKQREEEDRLENIQKIKEKQEKLREDKLRELEEQEAWEKEYWEKKKDESSES